MENIRYYTLEIIADELLKNDIYTDITVIARYIGYILEKYKDTCNDVVNKWDSNRFADVFTEINMNNFGRAAVYLTIVYHMNILEENVLCEAVRLLVPALKHITPAVEVDEGYKAYCFMAY